MHLPFEISNKGTLDYHAHMMKHPDKILEQSEWTSFTEPFLMEQDYQDERTKNQAMKDFISDLQTFDGYGNYDYRQLDSYRVEKIIINEG